MSKNDSDAGLIGRIGEALSFIEKTNACHQSPIMALRARTHRMPMYWCLCHTRKKTSHSKTLRLMSIPIPRTQTPRASPAACVRALPENEARS